MGSLNTPPPPSAKETQVLPTSTPIKDLSKSWQGPGSAAFDFRSDTITTPTLSMLRAIEQSTLMDDVYREDPTTNDFESYIANLTGKEAALLVMSGTMGNQVALRSLLQQPPHSILCHHLSHIIQWEAGGCAALSQAQVNGIQPSNGLYLRLEDIKKHVLLTTDIHRAPTRVISLENTLNGTVTPLSEVRRISQYARRNNIKMHLDGARIWECVASGAGSLPDFLQYFDTAQLCFSKGLAAPIGSIIVGTRPVIDHARWIRKSIGGGIRQAGIIAAAARVAVDEGFGTDPNGSGGRLRQSHERARLIAGMWTHLGGKLGRPTETNMVWLDFESVPPPRSSSSQHVGQGQRTQDGEEVSAPAATAADGRDHGQVQDDKETEIIDEDLFDAIGIEEGVRLMGTRLVVHYQISEQAIGAVERVFKRVLVGGEARRTMRKSMDDDDEYDEAEDEESKNGSANATTAPVRADMTEEEIKQKEKGRGTKRRMLDHLGDDG